MLFKVMFDSCRWNALYLAISYAFKWYNTYFHTI